MDSRPVFNGFLIVTIQARPKTEFVTDMINSGKRVGWVRREARTETRYDTRPFILARR